MIYLKIDHLVIRNNHSARKVNSMIPMEYVCVFALIPYPSRGCRGRDRMVVGFTTTCAISAYHH